MQVDDDHDAIPAGETQIIVRGARTRTVPITIETERVVVVAGAGRAAHFFSNVHLPPESSGSPSDCK